MIRSTTPGGGRKPTEETRAKLKAAGARGWASLAPEQRTARLAALEAGRQKRRAPTAPPPVIPPADPPAPEGPRSPLDDAPRARGGSAPALPRPEGLSHGSPVFRVPDFAALPEPEPIPGSGDLSDIPPAGGVAVSQAQVESLLRFPFAFVALRRGKHWKLRDDEAAMVAEPLTRKLNESAIASRTIALGGDWAVIAGGLALVVWARLEEDDKHGERPGAARSDNGARARDVPADDDRWDGTGAPGGGPGGHGGGTLNGFSTGPAGVDGAPSVAAEARSRALFQAL